MAEGQNTAAVVSALSQTITQLAGAAASAPPVATASGAKPGYQTTEFWLSALLTIFSSVAPIFTPALGPYAPLVGAVAAAGYAISRGMAKAPTPAVAPPAGPSA